MSELLLQAKEVELPLTVTKFGKPISTGSFITIDCDMVGVDSMNGAWTPAASSLGMSSNSSLGAVSKAAAV